MHRKLLNRINLEALAEADRSRAESEIRTLLGQLLAEEGTPLNLSERETLFTEVLDDVFGLGPLEPLLRDPSVSDVLVNTYNHVFVERAGVLERVPATFQDDAHLLRIIDRIVSRIGRRVDDSSPMVDARLEDGSRVNAIVPPLAVDGPLLSIRRFPAERLRASDLVNLVAMTPQMLEFLAHCVRARLNCLISGGTGAGKTTLLNALSSFISDRERIVTIEDAAELQLHQEHVARLETRPANVEGKGAIRQRQLVVNALRMRPDRIVVGEVRGEEALDMLQAMNTGHDGSLTTVHANTPRDALARIETMIAMGSTNLPERALRQQLASAIQLVVQQTRMSDGSRKVTSISEITGMEGDIITMQEIFMFEKRGVTQDGRGRWTIPANRGASKVCGAAQDSRHPAPDGHVRRQRGGAVMLVPIVVFVFVTALILIVYAAARRLPGAVAGERLERRLREVTERDAPEVDATILNQKAKGPLPVVDRLFTGQGGLARLIEQSGVSISPSAVTLISVAAAFGTGALTLVFSRRPVWALVAAFLASFLPFLWLKYKRSVRLRRFEEQFPEALDLLSRALRAGHAFQTAMSMVADELPAPVGTEFRKSFDQQNFGLPLKETLNELADRVPILDVRFFATAVSIQRETGGNLAEILDNLAHVVRERFKILRQVRVHTAQGRFTGYVLLGLPAFLAVALSIISPDHMSDLFEHRMGQTMLIGALVMQMVGFIWIRQVIKIEV